LNLLIQAFSTSNETYNLDPSNDVIDEGDRDVWLIEAGTSLFGKPFNLGDTNLDGLVNAADLNVLGLHWLDDDAASWSVGDFNGDHLVDGRDLNPVGLNWQSDIRSIAATVPEPQLSWLLVASLSAISTFCRKSFSRMGLHVDVQSWSNHCQPPSGA
jgi:hypothetical protein